jgi:hypothetical protein
MSANEEQASIKEEAGPKFWYVMEKIINKLPDNAKKSDIRKALKTMDGVANSFPCDDCVNSYNKYKEEHPLECSSKAECSNYLCEFHNNIRKKQGKSTIDCKTREEKNDCPGCNTEKKPIESEPSSGGTQLPDIEKQSDRDLGLSSELPTLGEEGETKLHTVKPVIGEGSTYLKKFVPVKRGLHNKKPVGLTEVSRVHDKATPLDELKNVRRNIIYQLCDKHGVERPEIIFNECPSKPNISCTRVPVGLDGKLVSGKKIKIYLDPNSASTRSDIHEALHHIAKLSGDDKLFRDELEIDKIAREIVSAGFTEYEAKVEPPSLPMPSQITYDIFSEGPNWLASGAMERAKNRLSEWKRNFPTFNRLFSGPATDTAPVAVNTSPEPPVKAEPVETTQHTAYTDGFLTMIDPIFAPIANVTGLQPRDVTDAHVPNILGNVVTTVADSNLNDFGALLVSAGTAGITLLLGAAVKDSLGMGDRRFLMGLGGNLLWNSLAYIANPKRSKSVFTHASQFGKAISVLDVQQMNYCVSYQGAMDSQGKPIPKLSAAEIRGLQKEQGFQPDVPVQNSYPIQGQSTGGIGAPYGGRAVPAQYPSTYNQAPTGGVRPYGNLDGDFDEYSLEENNRIARAQRSAFSPAIA